MATTPRPRPYTLDFTSSASLSEISARLAVLFGNADFMFQELYEDLTAVASDVAAVPVSGSAITLTAGTVAGRGAASGTGAEEQIVLGTGLAMSGTTLSASGPTRAQALTRVFLGT